MIPGSTCLNYKVSAWWAVGWSKLALSSRGLHGYSWSILRGTLRCCSKKEWLVSPDAVSPAFRRKQIMLKDRASLTCSQLRRVKRDFESGDCKWTFFKSTVDIFWLWPLAIMVNAHIRMFFNHRGPNFNVSHLSCLVSSNLWNKDLTPGRQRQKQSSQLKRHMVQMTRTSETHRLMNCDVI